MLGHSFGRAIRIYHDESEEATAATVQVTTNAIVLVITGGDNAGTYTYNFSTYSTLVSLVNVIEQADTGFVPTLVEGANPSEPSVNLHVVDATNCLGLTNRQVLCISQLTETFDGGEHMIFTSLPIQSVVSVLHDGETETDYWEKSAGYLIAKYSEGSQYSPYLMDFWSVKQPCSVQVTYVPTFLRIPGVMKLIVKALCQHIMLDSSYASESIGDYSYSLGDFWGSIAPFWTMISQYSINFQP